PALAACLTRLPKPKPAALAPLVAGKPSHDDVLARTIAGTPTVLGIALSDRATPLAPTHTRFAVAGDDPRPFLPNFSGATGNLPGLDAAAAGIGSVNWLPDRDQV